MAVGLDHPDFTQLAEDVKRLPSKPDNDRLLKLYAHFKQATVGDNQTDEPGVFDLTGKAKWNAWHELRGMSQEDATVGYIEVAKRTIAKHS
ncbi:acyl-CoA-binding protein [Streptomyces sp. NPDC058989]|uniref:acyl-CoA-binding protein n=1 Tax=Streptomyces sp. NPDC058989 TaxID=3346686 RepID=UPI0036932850